MTVVSSCSCPGPRIGHRQCRPLTAHEVPPPRFVSNPTHRKGRGALFRRPRRAATEAALSPLWRSPRQNPTSRAIAVTTTTFGFPATTGRRYRWHILNCPRRCRTTQGSASSRAGSLTLTRAGIRQLQAPSTGARQARPRPPPRRILALLEGPTVVSPRPANRLARTVGAVKVPDLRHDRHRDDEPDAAHRLNRRNHWTRSPGAKPHRRARHAQG